MPLSTALTRREMSLIARNMGLATLVGGVLGTSRSAFAQQAKAVFGHFGSANPQTLSKATNSFQTAMGDRAKVEYVTVSAGPQILSAMAGDSMDICNLGSSPMVVGFGQGLKISMVYVQKVITDSECLAVRNEAGIAKLSDLKRKKIGLPFNTSVHFAMLGVLEEAGMRPADVTLINMRPDSILAAWRRKDIDATYIWYPVLGQAVADGGTILAKTGDLAAKGTLVFDAIIVRNAFKEQHPELVLAYLKEYDRLCRLYREKPDEVVATLAPFLSIKPEVAREYVTTFYTLAPQEMATDAWMGKPGAKDTGVLKTIRKQAEFLKAADQLKTVPASFEPFVDSSFLGKML